LADDFSAPEAIRRVPSAAISGMAAIQTPAPIEVEAGSGFF
jgi:hypothetical protein